MAAFTLPYLGVTVSQTGISAPSFSDILAAYTAAYKAIYGADVYLEPDSQDGQWIAVQATALNDANQGAIAAYNAFSPTTAQGVGLSSVVKINGLARLVASQSTVNVILTGTTGTIINNGVVADIAGNQFNLPSTVTIGIGGTVEVTATCTENGNITVPADTVTTIVTPTRGWQSVTNPSEATPGNPVEDDATLRGRQAVSTAGPAAAIIDSIGAAIQAVPGVDRSKVYENDTDTTDANGISPHSIAAVVEGGDVDAIAQAIFSRSTPGTGMDGDTSVTIIDGNGLPQVISFYELEEVEIVVSVTITALPGYLSTTGDAMKQAIADAISSLSVGTDSYLSKLYTAANLNGDPLNNTYNITLLGQAISPGSPTASDITIDFNQSAVCSMDDVTIVVSP